VLNIRIGHILFQSNGANGQWDIYTANLALRIILNVPEVSGFMKAHDIVDPFGFPPGSVGTISSFAGAWPAGSPHISGSLVRMGDPPAMPGRQ